MAMRVAYETRCWFTLLSSFAIPSSDTLLYHKPTAIQNTPSQRLLKSIQRSPSYRDDGSNSSVFFPRARLESSTICSAVVVGRD